MSAGTADVEMENVGMGATWEEIGRNKTKMGEYTY